MATWMILAVLCIILPLNYGDSLPGVSPDDVYVEGALYNRTHKIDKSPTTKDWADPVIKCGIKHNVSYEVTFSWIPPHPPTTEDESKNETTNQQNPPSSTVKFTKVGQHAVGVWTCVMSDPENRQITQTVVLNSYPQILSMHRSINLVEGESLELECEAWGYPEPKISWRRFPEDGSDDQAQPINASDPRISFTTENSSYVNSELHIRDTVLGDRDKYECVATSQVDGVDLESSYATLVRVKSRLAPLWPFIGILAEVIVLAAIIGGYELYRRKQKAEGDDKDAIQNQHPEDARKKK